MKRCSAFIILFVLTTMLSLMIVAAAPDVSCDVPSGSYADIQSAVDDAGCDIINLTANMYTENVSIPLFLEILKRMAAEF